MIGNARLNIVMPMAGRGSRFVDAGFQDPKPLIDVRGRPMYAWATDSMPLSLADRIVFVCQREHLDDLRLRDDIETRYAAQRPIIVPLDEVTEGQACTVLKAREYIDNDAHLIIYNADTFCRTDLETVLPTLDEKVDGLFHVFEAPGDKWSFAKVDENMRVLETAEKVRISSWASTGLYHFRRGSAFVRAADAAIAEGDKRGNEYYVAPLYNRLLADGAHIVANRALEVWGLGTPEDLADFEARYPR